MSTTVLANLPSEALCNSFLLATKRMSFPIVRMHDNSFTFWTGFSLAMPAFCYLYIYLFLLIYGAMPSHTPGCRWWQIYKSSPTLALTNTYTPQPTEPAEPEPDGIIRSIKPRSKRLAMGPMHRIFSDLPPFSISRMRGKNWALHYRLS